ncbi:hypothetical protein LSH36_713g01022 [Paralvinella palmiformis]|uniref:LolA-like domain-containing protein n=1 Tax=Paralvinella palmiformis TaxID=53620 RepID=A0AAD9J2X2_9ANNE|nr:hypothetical protein LSH36_713g01022 [Paralvinella palmiformis]
MSSVGWKSPCQPRPQTHDASRTIQIVELRLILVVVVVVSVALIGGVTVAKDDVPGLSASLRDQSAVTPPDPSNPAVGASVAADDVSSSRDWEASFERGLFPPTDVRPCFGQDVPDRPGQQVPLPDIDDQFEARIEAKIIQKGYTVSVEEFYDYPNNRGMVRRTKAGVSSTWIYDFRDYVSFLVVGSNCWLSDLRHENFQLFNFTFGGSEGHIGGVSQLFSFGTQYNETFVGGNETVRGIPVNHWTSCIEWKRYDAVFQLDYYFSKPDYSMPSGKRSIPVQAVLKVQGVQYVLDKVSRNCSLSRLTLNTVDADPRMNDPSHVIMRHGRDLFDLDQLNFSYQGKRLYREISCQVWAALRVNWPQQGTNTTVEIYFNKNNWTTEAETGGAKQPDIVGLWLTLVDSTDNYVSEWVNHIFSYSAKDPNLELFDVFDCYSKNEKLDVKFRLQVSYLELVRRGLMFAQQAVHIQIAQVSKLHPIRLANIRFEDVDKLNTEVTVTLLEEAMLQDDSVSHHSTITAKQAYEVFENQTNSSSGFQIKVDYPEGIVEYKVMPGSVMIAQLNKKQDNQQCPLTSKRLYTSGSMAGLGISMLLLGIAAGAAGMFFHKTNKPLVDIPYRAQD